MFHRSERLLLRPIWPEDWRGIFSGIADECVVRNLARAPWPYHESDAREFAAQPLDCASTKFLITRAADAAIVGCIGLDPMAEEDIELGYWIARPYWGQGYASEAGHSALEIARTLGHGRIVASHFLDNPASGRVLEKLGFVPTGRTLMRHSLGRGTKAMTREYSLQMGGAEIAQKAAA